MMRKYKTMKGLDDSCEGGSAKKADSLPWSNGTEESRVRKLNQTFRHKLCPCHKTNYYEYYYREHAESQSFPVGNGCVRAAVLLFNQTNGVTGFLMQQDTLTKSTNTHVIVSGEKNTKFSL